MKSSTDIPDTDSPATDDAAKKPSFCFIMPFHISEGRGGGAEVQAWLLARELAQRGFAVSYIAQSVEGRQGHSEKIDGVTIRWIKYAHHFRWTNGWQYYRALSGLRPDIVVERMSSFTTGVAALWCRRKGARFVWICTGDASPRRWLFYRRQIELNSTHAVGWLKGAVFLMNSVIQDVSRHWGLQRADYLFTQNDEQEVQLAASVGRKSLRMISGHPLPEHIQTPDDRLTGGIILWVANLGPNKRPELFIELARRCNRPGLRFVMIGGRADAAYVDELFENAPERLEWLDRLPFDETSAWFDRAAFLVNTSIVEGFPNTFIQAWLRGVPVLSTGVDPDAVIEANGLGFVNGDLSVLLAKIYQLSTNLSRYKKLSRHVRNYAAENLTTGRMTDNFLVEIAKEQSREKPGIGHL